MPEVKWIKLVTDFFENSKIDYLMGLPESDAIIIIWIRLLTLAGISNENGYIILTKNIPYNLEMLAHRCRKSENIVRAAIELFKKLEMVIEDENGLKVKNWEKYQNIEGLEKIRLNARLRQKRFKEKQKELIGNVSDNVNATLETTEITPLEYRSKNKDINIKTYVSEFEEFWKNYPRKTDKKQAYFQWKARVKSGVSSENLLFAAKNYAAECKHLKREERYIKHAKTFIGINGSYEEYFEKKVDSEELDFKEYGVDNIGWLPEIKKLTPEEEKTEEEAFMERIKEKAKRAGL